MTQLEITRSAVRKPQGRRRNLPFLDQTREIDYKDSFYPVSLLNVAKLFLRISAVSAKKQHELSTVSSVHVIWR